MKVYFVPHYLYTHFQYFDTLKNALIEKKISVKFFYVVTDKLVHDGNFEYLNRIHSNNIIRPNLFITSNNSNIFYRVNKLIKHLINFIVLKNKLLKDLPDLVILGTDTGGISIRMVQHVCKKYNIPIVVAQSVLFLPTKERLELKSNYSNLILNFLDMLGFRKIFTYIGEIPGMYYEDNYVFCIGDSSKRIMEAFGKNPKYIYKIGNPFYDTLKNKTNSNINKKLLSHNKFTNNKVITYFTEMIQEVNGEDYFDKVNSVIKSVFDNLDFDITVIIKPHPRENEYFIKKLINHFKGVRYFVDLKTESNTLISESILSIAHNSTILFNALIINKPIISINFINNDSFLKFPKIFLVESHYDLYNLVNKILFDDNFKYLIRKEIYCWKINNISHSEDHSSTRHAVDAILTIYKQHKTMIDEYC